MDSIQCNPFAGRRNALVVPCMMAAIFASPVRATPSVTNTPHNIIVILVDDVGKDMIGAYEDVYANHPDPAFPNTTPAIDELARTGIQFNNVWTSILCSPTRAQILSGRRALYTGLGEAISFDRPNGGGLREDIPIIPTVLRQAPTPYDTALVGKWHLVDVTQPIEHALGTETTPWFHRYAGSLYNLHYEDGGYNHWTKTFASAINPLDDECSTAPCQAVTNVYASVNTTDDAIHLLGVMREPFFLQMSFNAVHWPLEAPLTAPAAASCALVQTDPLCDSTFDDSDRPRDTRCMVQWLDNEVGRLLCALDEQTLEQPVTLIFLSDNGARGDASAPPFDAAHGKGTAYEGGISVPFIVRSPLIPAELEGSTHDALVMSQDILATAADLAGASLLPDPNGLVDSRSMLPYITGQLESEREYAYSERFRPNFIPDEYGGPPQDYSPNRHTQAARDLAGYKLIHHAWRSGDRILVSEHFFDLADDPHEQIDLIAQVDLPPLAEPYARLKDLLDHDYPNLTGMIDGDGDGWVNSADNCLSEPNADQRDSDGDDFGNACDTDLNNDCVTNTLDLALLREYFLTNDPDADFDGDGHVNFHDVAIMRSAWLLAPGPSEPATLCN